MNTDVQARGADQYRWRRFRQDNPDVEKAYQSLCSQVATGAARKNSLISFKRSFMDGPGQYVVKERSSVQTISSDKGCKVKAKTLEQLVSLYNSVAVAKNVANYLREHGASYVSPMTGTEVFDHPEEMMKLSVGTTKSIAEREDLGVEQPQPQAQHETPAPLALRWQVPGQALAVQPCTPSTTVSGTDSFTPPAVPSAPTPLQAHVPGSSAASQRQPHASAAGGQSVVPRRPAAPAVEVPQAAATELPEAAAAELPEASASGPEPDTEGPQRKALKLSTREKTKVAKNLKVARRILSKGSDPEIADFLAASEKLLQRFVS